MKIRTILSGCSILVLCGCSDIVLTEPVTSEIRISVKQTAKTTLDTSAGNTGVVLWQKGDRVHFQFDDTANTTATAACTQDGRDGLFRVSIPSGAASINAVYFPDPKEKLVSFPSRGKATITLPSIFDCAWTFDRVNALAGTATVDKGSITMKPVFGLLEFRTGRNDVDKVIFSCKDGAVLGDSYTIDFASGTVTPSAARHSSATFFCNCAGGPFYIPVPEGSYSGFVMEIYAFGTSEMIGAVDIPAIEMKKGRIVNLGVVDSKIGTPSVIPADDIDRSAVCSFGLDRKVRFNAGKAWSASTTGNISLDRKSGAAGEYEITVSFPANKESTPQYSTVIFHSEGANDVIIGFAQNRKPDCSVVFRKYPDAYSSNSQYREWTGTGSGPYGLFLEKMVNGAFGYYTHAETGLKIGFFSNVEGEGNLQYNETGFMVGLSGNGKGGYIEFPAISGKRLTKVELFTSAASTNQCVRCSICDMTGAVVAGGETVTNSINTLAVSQAAVPSIAYELTNASESLLTWNLTGTEPGTPYKLNFSSRGMVRWFTLYYE